jgi:phospholipid transport system substrate-binding protein
VRVLAAFVLLLSGAAAAVAGTGIGPDELVRETSQRMFATLEAERDRVESDPAVLYGLVEEIVVPHFDFERMGRWVLGKYWRRASREQRQRFVAEFRTLLVRSYATALLEYPDHRITYLPARIDEQRNAASVRLRIDRKGGAGHTHYIDYRMYRGGAGWKVFDVAVDGVSLITNFRQSFGQEIQQRGLDGLIEHLSRKNRQAGA